MNTDTAMIEGERPLELATGCGALPLDEGFKLQVRALYKSGCSIEQIATSLGRTELEVKQVVIGDTEALGVNGEIGFTSGERMLVKAQLLRLALNGESDSIRLKAATWIADKCSVSEETRFRAKNGMNAPGNTVNNIMIAIEQAKAKSRGGSNTDNANATPALDA